MEEIAQECVIEEAYWFSIDTEKENRNLLKK